MRFIHLIIFLFAANHSFSQDSIPVRRVDTLLPFFGNHSLNLYGYENRSVPFNDKLPLYVLITYPGGKVREREYFRMDSSTYLMYQFFRSDKGSSNKGLKSFGNLRIIDAILDSSNTIGINASSGNRSKLKRYYKGFSKEGEWEEYTDSLFFHQYWRGQYKNGKRVGLWTNFIYDPTEDRLVSQIDYDKDSTAMLYTVNLAGYLSPDSIRYYLTGRWLLGCEDDRDKRMLMSKCQLYDGHFGDDCNSRFGDENYYEFFAPDLFKRQKGETCNKFKQQTTTGKWTVVRKPEGFFS